MNNWRISIKEIDQSKPIPEAFLEIPHRTSISSHDMYKFDYIFNVSFSPEDHLLKFHCIKSRDPKMLEEVLIRNTIIYGDSVDELINLLGDRDNISSILEEVKLKFKNSLFIRI